MSYITLKPHELRSVMVMLHECQKKKKCVVKTGIGISGIQKIKCDIIYTFGLSHTRDLEPRIYKSCFKKVNRKKK